MPLRKPSYKTIFKAGMAMFSLIFGAGNIIYPVLVGITAGAHNLVWGLAGFFITAIFIPIIGIISIVIFDGDYRAYFQRIGKIPGHILIFLCMLMIGPLIATPRLINLSYVMVNSVVPLSFYIFIPIFLAIIFVSSFRLKRVLSLLGNFITPILLGTLFLVTAQALWSAQASNGLQKSALRVFFSNIYLGYETLDLIAVIFLSSTILLILKRSMGKANRKSQYLDVAQEGLKAGLISMILLAVTYVLLSFIGLYGNKGLSSQNEMEIFQKILLKAYTQVLTALMVLLACVSTAIGYAITVSEYMREELFQKNVSYPTALGLYLLLCIPVSLFGLDTIMVLSRGPIVYIGYPIIIALAVLNIFYKIYKVEMVKIPVSIVAIISTIMYIWIEFSDLLVF